MRRAVLLTILAALQGAVAMAQTLEIGPALVTRADTLKGMLQPKDPLNGAGKLTLNWTDCWGRTVASETQDVQVQGDNVAVSMPLNRAVAMQNFLECGLQVGQTTVKTPKTEFFVTPSAVWDDYQIIMYYPYDTPAQQWALRDAGITAGQIQSSNTQKREGAARWLAYDYPYYCDQIATAFYAAYHTPAQEPKEKALIDAKALYQKDRTSKAAFVRKPSLSDPQALAAAVTRIQTAVASHMRAKPFLYAHTDEGGVADLVSAWDFDFSPVALDAMRKWLLARYGSLEAINTEWGTQFARIEDVVPFTTDEMMARGDDNLSPWADHRAFMNQAFADALLAGTRAGHEVDKDARLGLVGCQMPAAFGGYDYWLLSQVMDCIEPYNIGNNREIWRSLAPGKPAITTAFGFGDMEVWRLWYQALHGDQGIIIYDEKNQYLDASGKLTKMAADIAPTYRELTGGIVKQLHYMAQPPQQVAIHYSQPSITAQWMFESRPGGGAWVNQGSGSERRRSPFLRLRESWVKLIEDSQQPYGFVAYAQLENGAFANSPARVLVLPQSVAMSAKECQAVRDFAARGGTVIADCRTALMDEHCKALAQGQLDDLFGIERTGTKFAPAPGPAGLSPNSVDSALAPWEHSAALDKVPAADPGLKTTTGTALYHDANGTPAFIVRQHGKGMTIYLNAVVTDYHRWRLKPPEGNALQAMVASILNSAGASGDYAIMAKEKTATGIELFPFASGDLRVLAVHRNYQLRVNELGPPEYQKQDALEQPLDLKINLGGEYAVYDARAGKYLGKKSTAEFSLDKYQPTILALLPEPVEALKIDAADVATGGTLVDVKLTLVAPKVGDTHAFRVVVKGPDGKEIRPLTRTLVAPKGQVVLQIPIAVSDPAGTYILYARDVATGVGAERKISIK